MSSPPSSNRSSALVPSPAPGSLVAYEPLFQPIATVGIVIAGASVSSPEQLRQHLDSLSPEEVVNTFRNIQDQIRGNAEQLQDIAADIWNLAQTRQVMQTRRARDTAAFDQEFSILRDGHQQSTTRRHRLAEAQNRLTADWMTAAFLNTVVLQQTNGSTTVLDALNSARSFGTPGHVMARASAFRLQRLARIGPYSRYATGDLVITPQDIRFATATPLAPVTIHLQNENAAALRHNLVADGHGIHWIRGIPPPGINDAYQNAGARPHLTRGSQSPLQTLPSSSIRQASPLQTLPSSSIRQASPRHASERSPERRRSSPAPQSPRAGPVSPSIRPSLETDPARIAICPQPLVSYAGMQASLKRPRQAASPGPPTTPPRASRAQSEPAFGAQGDRINLGPRPADIMELIGDLRTMTVSPSKSPLNPGNVKLVPLPIQKPSPLDSALWNHVLRKAQAIAERRKPPQPTSQQRYELANSVNSLPNLQASIQRLTSGVQKAPGITEDNLRAYLEGLADGSSVAFAAYDHDQFTVAGLRELAARLQSAFDGGSARIGNGNENEQGFTVAPSDFNTLIRDEQHTGWLNSSVLMAALLGIARAKKHREDSFVVHVDQVLQYRLAQITVENVRMPSVAQNLVIPLHWGNHWTVGLVNVHTRTIYHMDSLHDGRRHRDAISMIQQLLAQYQDLFGQGAWTVSTLRSGKQENSDDCGLWVIENARQLIEGTNTTPYVSAATRRYIAEELFTYLIRDTPTLTEQSRRENEVTHARAVAANALGPGRSQSQPFSVRDSCTPGPDMPHLPSVPQPPPTGNQRGQGSGRGSGGNSPRGSHRGGTRGK